MKTKILGLLAVGLLAGPMAAGAVTLNAVDSGWYNDAGFHDATNQNYIAGLCSDCGGAVFRNFFVFDLTGVGPVSSATLRQHTRKFADESRKNSGDLVPISWTEVQLIV